MADLKRRALCDELVKLHTKHATDLARIEEIKQDLRKIAGADEANFKEEFGAAGSVEVRAPTDEKYKGELPELNAAVYVQLTKARKAKLVADGLVELKQVWTRKFYGSVTVRI